MHFMELTQIQIDSYKLVTDQKVLIGKVNRSGKVTKEDWAKQKKLLARRQELIKRLKDILEKSSNIIEQKTVQRLVDEQELTYLNAKDEMQKFEDGFELKDGLYQPKVLKS